MPSSGKIIGARWLVHTSGTIFSKKMKAAPWLAVFCKRTWRRHMGVGSIGWLQHKQPRRRLWYSMIWCSTGFKPKTIFSRDVWHEWHTFLQVYHVVSPIHTLTGCNHMTLWHQTSTFNWGGCWDFWFFGFGHFLGQFFGFLFFSLKKIQFFSFCCPMRFLVNFFVFLAPGFSAFWQK